MRFVEPGYSESSHSHAGAFGDWADLRDRRMLTDHSTVAQASSSSDGARRATCVVCARSDRARLCAAPRRYGVCVLARTLEGVLGRPSERGLEAQAPPTSALLHSGPTAGVGSANASSWHGLSAGRNGQLVIREARASRAARSAAQNAELARVNYRIATEASTAMVGTETFEMDDPRERHRGRHRLLQG